MVDIPFVSVATGECICWLQLSIRRHLSGPAVTCVSAVGTHINVMILVNELSFNTMGSPQNLSIEYVIYSYTKGIRFKTLFLLHIYLT